MEKIFSAEGDGGRVRSGPSRGKEWNTFNREWARGESDVLQNVPRADPALPQSFLMFITLAFSSLLSLLKPPREAILRIEVLTGDSGESCLWLVLCLEEALHDGR